MADKVMEEAIRGYSNEALLRGYKNAQDNIKIGKAAPYNQKRKSIIENEMLTRLEALAENQNSYDVKDLDSIIAMAESVGMFSQKAEVAQIVLKRAQTQKAALDSIDIVNDTPSSQPDTPSEQQDKTNDSAQDNPIEVVSSELDDVAKEIAQQTQERLVANDAIINNIPSPLATDKDGKLLNQEFNDEVTALKNLIITNDTGRDLTPEEQNEARMSLHEAAQLEAETYARALGDGNKENVTALYNKHYKEALQKNIVAAAFASSFKAEMSQEEVADKFLQALEKPQKADIKAINAVAAQSATNSQGVVAKLKNKFKSIPVVQKMENKVKDFDQKMTDRYGEMYTTSRDIAKNVGKTLLNVGKYSVLSAVAGSNAPLVFAAIAVKGAYDTFHTMRKEAAKEKKTFWQYVKANKFKVGATCATTTLALGGAILGLSSGAENAETRSKLTAWSRGLMVFKHAAPAFLHTTSGLYKKYVKKDPNGASEDFNKSKQEWKQSATALLGVLTGKLVSPFVSDTINDAKDYVTDTFNEAKDYVADVFNGGNDASADITSAPQMTFEEMTKTLEHMGLSPDRIDSMSPEAMQQYIMSHPQDFNDAREVMQDKDKDGKPDVYDTDHGEGWATANETQLNRLMDADPAKVNALLGGTDYKSSDLREMLENGQFSDEQLKAIHGLATKEFDKNGHIIDADLKEFYEKLAKEAAEKEAAEKIAAETKNPENKNPENKNPENQDLENKTPEPQQPEQSPQMTEKEQRAYEEILKAISKGERMDDPEIRSSVEGLAKSYLNAFRDDINSGNKLNIAERIVALHNQGENQEIAEATQQNENDSRKMANAKEDLLKAKSELDAAKEALAQDPNNQKLQKEVADLEKKFDKESIDLQQRNIKEADSQLKDQIKEYEKNFKDMDKSYETIERDFGVSEEQVGQKLAAMGIDVNNLPQDLSNLPAEAQHLIAAHNMYTQAHQQENDLKDRIAANQQAREDLKKFEDNLKAEDKNVNKGMGLSQEAEEILPGQSNVANSDLLHAIQDMMQEQQNPNVSENGVKAGEDTGQTPSEQQAGQEAAEEKVAEDGKQEQTPSEQQAGQEAADAQAGIYTIESSRGNINYFIDENGNLNEHHSFGKYTGSPEARREFEELANDIRDHKYGENNKDISNLQKRISEINASTAMAYQEIRTDIQSRVASGEDVPHADKAIKLMESQLNGMGLKFNENGKVSAINDRSDVADHISEEEMKRMNIFQRNSQRDSGR